LREEIEVRICSGALGLVQGADDAWWEPKHICPTDLAFIGSAFLIQVYARLPV